MYIYMNFVTPTYIFEHNSSSSSLQVDFIWKLFSKVMYPICFIYDETSSNSWNAGIITFVVFFKWIFYKSVINYQWFSKCISLSSHFISVIDYFSVSPSHSLWLIIYRFMLIILTPDVLLLFVKLNCINSYTLVYTQNQYLLRKLTPREL